MTEPKTYHVLVRLEDLPQALASATRYGHRIPGVSPSVFPEMVILHLDEAQRGTLSLAGFSKPYLELYPPVPRPVPAEPASPVRRDSDSE